VPFPSHWYVPLLHFAKNLTYTQIHGRHDMFAAKRREWRLPRTNAS
jgi:hypothetical protein